MSDYTAKQIPEMDTFYKGLFRRARAEVGATSFGLAVIELGPDADNHPDRNRPGSDGMRLLAIGGTPGEAYSAPAYTEVGAPDPLAD